MWWVPGLFCTVVKNHASPSKIWHAPAMIQGRISNHRLTNLYMFLLDYIQEKNGACMSCWMIMNFIVVFVHLIALICHHSCCFIIFFVSVLQSSARNWKFWHCSFSASKILLDFPTQSYIEYTRNSGYHWQLAWIRVLLGTPHWQKRHALYGYPVGSPDLPLHQAL